jgi:exopolysaccharide biosynthesis polyprenyl glycosylphosphotransferase
MTLALALLEAGAIFAAWCAATVLRQPLFWHGWADAASTVAVAGTLALATIAALYYGDCYELRMVPDVGRFATRLARYVVLAAVALVAAWTLRPGVVPVAVGTTVLMAALLLALRAAFYRLLNGGAFERRVLIVGSNAQARTVVAAIEEQGRGRYTIVGVVEDAPGGAEVFRRHRLLGPLTELDRIIDTTRPDRIVVALEERRGRLPVRPLLEARLRGIVVEEGAELYERLTGKIAIESLTPTSLIFSPRFRPALVAPVVARLISLVVAVAGLVAFLPVLGLIALGIRLESAGPIFFVQERVGRGGRRFQLLKFRTMHMTGAAPSEWVCDNHDRITRLGYWLRRFRLDELPQFVNILRGEMDLVGPRPHPVTNFSLFVTVLRNSPECGEQIPYYSLRAMVRPGITGWAQVRYRYANNLEEEIEKVRYDLYYVKHRSLWLDLRILADTLKTVLTGHGAIEAETGAAPAPTGSSLKFAARPR